MSFHTDLKLWQVGEVPQGSDTGGVFGKSVSLASLTIFPEGRTLEAFCPSSVKFLQFCWLNAIQPFIQEVRTSCPDGLLFLLCLVGLNQIDA